tara:strand:- start:703 stop:999 length:297 start_codon:yes stop_codon:yes gene_type:complete
VKFFKNAVYVLFAMSLVNLAGSFYMHRDIMSKVYTIDVHVPIPENLKDLPAETRSRESQIMQGILILHHEAGIHQPNKQPMCPMCDVSQGKITIVENN